MLQEAHLFTPYESGLLPLTLLVVYTATVKHRNRSLSHSI